MSIRRIAIFAKWPATVLQLLLNLNIFCGLGVGEHVRKLLGWPLFKTLILQFISIFLRFLEINFKMNENWKRRQSIESKLPEKKVNKNVFTKWKAPNSNFENWNRISNLAALSFFLLPPFIFFLSLFSFFLSFWNGSHVSPHQRGTVLTKKSLPSVLPDLAIYRHLGDFFNHLVTNILIWRLENLATFWATF